MRSRAESFERRSLRDRSATDPLRRRSFESARVHLGRLSGGAIEVAKRSIHRTLHRFGIDVHRLVWLNLVEDRRRQALTEQRVDVLLDVGANAGMYAQDARKLGYDGQIMSFEPGTDAFEKLGRVSAKDPLWTCRQLALGEVEGRAKLNLSANAYSSSLLPITERSVRAAPQSAYVGSEDVEVARLDAIRDELFDRQARVFLKLDVQGAELQVLRGASATLGQVHAIEAEVSVQPVYAGQALITDVVSYLDDVGFDLVALEPIFRDPRTGKLLQFDAFFLRRRP